MVNFGDPDCGTAKTLIISGYHLMATPSKWASNASWSHFLCFIIENGSYSCPPQSLSVGPAGLWTRDLPLSRPGSPNWANQAAVEIIINNYILLYNYLYNYIILIITTYYYIINNYILYILLVTCLSNAVWIFLSVKPSPRSFGRRVKRIEISKERPERSAFVPFDKTGFQNVQVNVSTASFQKFHG